MEERERSPWHIFYSTLSDRVTDVITGFHPNLANYPRDQAKSTDNFWSVEMADTFPDNWDDDPEWAMRKAVALYAEEIAEHLSRIFAMGSPLAGLLGKEAQAYMDRIPDIAPTTDEDVWRDFVDSVLAQYNAQARPQHDC